MNDGIVIFLGFCAIVAIPAAIVFLVLAISRRSRNRKIQTYTGRTSGTILKITKRGIDAPFVIAVGYRINGIAYEISETAKLQSHTITIGRLPIGQKKTFVLGPVKEGDSVEIHYDESNPQNAIIHGNEGVTTI